MTTASSSGFSADARTAVDPWVAAIQAHPFLTGLADGSLPEAVFARYLIDDAHYLIGYARALACLAARIGDPQAAATLAASSAGALAAERDLHRTYLVPRGLDPDAPGAVPATPTCRGYVDRLQVTAALDPVEVGMAAVLPCFRVYAEVGAAILARVPAADHPAHPYRAWIDAYGAPEFAAAVAAAEAITDDLAAASAPVRQAAMLQAYAASTRDEWRFWDAAWRGEGWPAPDRDGPDPAAQTAPAD